MSTIPLTDTDDLVTASNERLEASLEFWTGKIDGPETNGRVTAHGSFDLDYWMDNAEACRNELQRRTRKL
jgi:hypothetical protein